MYDEPQGNDADDDVWRWTRPGFSNFVYEIEYYLKAMR